MGEAQAVEMHRHVIEKDSRCVEFKEGGDATRLERRMEVLLENYHVAFEAPEDIPLRKKYIEFGDSEDFRGHSQVRCINGARITCIVARHGKGGTLKRGGPGFDGVELVVDGVLHSYGFLYDESSR